MNGAEQLTTRIEEGLTVAGAEEIAAPFLPALTSSSPAGREQGVQAILLYGSTLWKATRDKTSQPDLIVVVDSLSAWYRRFRDRLWGAVLPPTVHCVRDGGALAKVSVVTARQLASQTSNTAKDLHLAGRLSKRVALVWSRDPQARARVVDAKRAALTTVARLTLSRFEGAISLDDFLMAMLGLSYESEVRIVEPGKIASLLDVERDHYRCHRPRAPGCTGRYAGRRFGERLPAASQAPPMRAQSWSVACADRGAAPIYGGPSIWSPTTVGWTTCCRSSHARAPRYPLRSGSDDTP